ncbi:hypothetical protein Unana1_07695 [Umbelopsis nana]
MADAYLEQSDNHMSLPVPAFDWVWDETSDSDEAGKRFVKILEYRYTSAGRMTDDIRAEALTQLARTQGLGDKFDLAKETLARAKETSTAAIPNIRYLLEYGRVLRSSGKPDESAPYFRQAYDAAVNVEDFYATDAAHMLAILDAKAGPVEGKTWSEVALEISRKSEHIPTKRWAAIILNNTAWDAFDEGDYQKALDQFIEASEMRKKALEANETARTKETYRIARWSIAYTLRHMDRDEEAYTIQKQLLAEGETKPNREELAILAEKLGHGDEAAEHEKAVKEFESK